MLETKGIAYRLFIIIAILAVGVYAYYSIRNMTDSISFRDMFLIGYGASEGKLHMAKDRIITPHYEIDEYQDRIAKRMNREIREIVNPKHGYSGGYVGCFDIINVHDRMMEKGRPDVSIEVLFHHIFAIYLILLIVMRMGVSYINRAIYNSSLFVGRKCIVLYLCGITLFATAVIINSPDYFNIMLSATLYVVWGNVILLPISRIEWSVFRLSGVHYGLMSAFIVIINLISINAPNMYYQIGVAYGEGRCHYKGIVSIIAVATFIIGIVIYAYYWRKMRFLRKEIGSSMYMYLAMCTIAVGVLTGSLDSWVCIVLYNIFILVFMYKCTYGMCGWSHEKDGSILFGSLVKR